MNKIKLKLNWMDSLKEKLSTFKVPAIVTFIILGVASTVWFLVRVIPKPSRAGYPCMRVAAPIMSGFVIYLITLSGSVLLFKRAYSKLKQARYKSAVIAIISCLVLVIVYSVNDTRKIFANTVDIEPVTTITWDTILPDGHNNPMGIGQGIFPGRVAWAWSPNATNANCTQAITDALFMPKNNNQDTINSMADKTIRTIGGQSTVSASWDAIFKYFNKRKTGTATGYQTGQTIFIKINNGQAGWATNWNDLSEAGETSAMTGDTGIAIGETDPSVVLAFVRQLVDSCNVPQSNIYIGEPMTHVFKSMYDLINANYPNVIILDKGDDPNISQASVIALGRTITAGWTTNSAITYSDKGKVMPDAGTDEIMLEMYNANYLINIAALKAHARAGVTFCAKLHFGSHGYHGSTYGYGSYDLHAGLILTGDNDDFTYPSNVRGNYHMYRVLTDLMMHPKLGRNTVLFIVDGLWGAIESTDMPVKWKTFGNEWPNSLFVSQDEVAVESVCLDFMRAEAAVNTLFNYRPFFPAVDDYLHQAADSANWPAGIKYDPGKTGTYISSLGVHEHWNNPTAKQYSKNLGTGNGIELVKVNGAPLTATSIKYFDLVSSFSLNPNPAKNVSALTYQLQTNTNVSIYLVSMDGKIAQHVKNAQLPAGSYTDNINVENLKSGMYICVLKTGDGIKTTKLEVR
jgi:hypothetical protein